VHLTRAMVPSDQQAENHDLSNRRRGSLFYSPYFWITVAFVLSRALYYWAGIRFDTHILASNFQFIDLQLLRTRLFESLFYFHMQPPLLNLLVGMAIKAFPDDYGAALHALYLVAGLSSAILLYIIMRRLYVDPKLSAGLTILFVVSPAAVLYENYPMYEYLIMYLLLASSVVLYKFILRPTFWRAFTFFSLLAALAWIRNLYHLLYILVIAVALAFYMPKQRNMVLTAASFPFATILALFLKNLVVFGLFSSSSWLGQNLLTVTIHQLTDSEKTSLIEQKKLPPIARVETGAPVADYRPFFPDVKPTGIPVLDQEVKSSGDVNTNNMLYLKADLAYRKAALQVLRYYPVAYLRSLVIAWFAYFRPPTDFFQFEGSRAPIRRFDRMFNLVFFGQLHEANNKELRVLRSQGHSISLALYTGIFLIIGFPFLFFWGLIYLVRGSRRRTLSPPQVGLLVFLILNIAYIVLTTNFLSSFENNRYAVPSDPLYVALLGLCLQQACLKSRRAEPRGDS
jgi:hypothetical protein